MRKNLCDILLFFLPSGSHLDVEAKLIFGSIKQEVLFLDREASCFSKPSFEISREFHHHRSSFIREYSGIVPKHYSSYGWLTTQLDNFSPFSSFSSKFLEEGTSKQEEITKYIQMPPQLQGRFSSLSGYKRISFF